VSALHLGIGPEFIEKDQVDDPPAREGAEPGRPLGYDIGAILLGGVGRLFFRGNFSR
jgi:hypothetical protein